MKKKKWLIPVVCIAVAAVSVLGVIRSGVLVKPTQRSLVEKTEVPAYDVHDWQFRREQDILADYGQGSYTLENPYIFTDPYEMNPLSALVLYETEPCDVTVTVRGDSAHSTFEYVKENVSGRAEIPILGLYAGRDNTVLLADSLGRSKELTIRTEPLPVSFQQYTTEVSQPEKMSPGVTLFIAFFEHSYPALVDCEGAVRGYISVSSMACETPLILLQNGNMLAAGDEYKMTPYNMASLFEYNWLGKIFREYEVPNAVHHGVFELPDGNLLATSNNKNMFETGTREDVAIVIDRESGAVVEEYDFMDILDDQRSPYHHFNPPIENAPGRDWMHMNSAVYDEDNNAVIVSSPTQSQVVSIDAETSEINWLLSPHEGYGGTSAFLQPYLLTPVGEGFEWAWCQHDAKCLPDMDSNPDTVDILLFDNGQNRSFTEEDAVAAADNYSRAVHYRIDTKAMTVEQIWQYGRERGAADYASFLGGVELLPNGNRLITFGGQLRMGEEPVDEVISGVLGNIATRSRTVEVTESGEVVFEVAAREADSYISAETYLIKRMPLYVPESFDYRLGDVRGTRLGSSYYCVQTDEFSPPNIHVGSLSADLRDVHREGGRLLVDGTLLYKGEPRLIGRAYIILRGVDGSVYTYQANSSINGRFIASIDLSPLPAGEYRIDVAGALIEGNDALNGKRLQGHFQTDYKITVE